MISVGDSDAEPTSVKVDNCNDQYCEVKRGSSAKIEMTFKLAADVNALTAEGKGELNGKWVNYSLGKQAKVCDNLLDGKKCPLKSGDEVTYAAAIAVPKLAPVGTKLLVQLRITDDKKKGVVCARVPVIVTK